MNFWRRSNFFLTCSSFYGKKTASPLGCKKSFEHPQRRCPHQPSFSLGTGGVQGLLSFSQREGGGSMKPRSGPRPSQVRRKPNSFSCWRLLGERALRPLGRGEAWSFWLLCSAPCGSCRCRPSLSRARRSKPRRAGSGDLHRLARSRLG